MTIDLYRCSPRQVTAFVEDCLYANLVPFIQSSPGMGKSSIVRALAEKLQLKLIDLRLSTCEPTDMTGLPRFIDGKAVFAPFEMFPLEDTPIPEGYKGWLLFFDEFNSANKQVQAAAYKVILDHMIGQHKMHPNVAKVCAGNLASDRAIVNELSTAMQSRIIHLEMICSFKEWLEDVAMPENYDMRLIAYLSQFNGKLMDFRPDHAGKTFCCPRTWEFMNRHLQVNPAVDETRAPLFAGTITTEVAAEFVQFAKVFEHLPKWKDIVADPTSVPVPMDTSTKWATIVMLLEHLDMDTFGPLIQYISKFSVEFRILFFRYVMVKNPGMRMHPAFAPAMSSIAEYLS